MQPALVVPVIALHELALVERLEGDDRHTPHKRDTILALTELYAEHAVSSGERALAADLLASACGYLRQTSSALSGIDLFTRALGLDPSNEAALAGIAAAREQHGRYARALSYLQRLTASHPGYEEGHLRLAINLRRTGHPARAARLVATVADAIRLSR